MFDELTKQLQSQDQQLHHTGLIGLRKIISKNQQLTQRAEVRLYVEGCLIDKCFQLVYQQECQHMRYEAIFILSNLTIDGEFCRMIVDKGAIKLMLTLIRQQKQHIMIDTAVWVLGNITADCAQYRDALLNSNGTADLITLINKPNNSRDIILRSFWVLSNICRTRPFPKLKQIKIMCSILCEGLNSGILDEENYYENLVQVLWTLLMISQYSKNSVEVMRKLGIMRKLMGFIMSNKNGVSIPALRMLGNISAKNQANQKELLKLGFLDRAFSLIDHPKQAFRIDICRILSNIANTESQRQALFSNQNLPNAVSLHFLHDQPKIKAEICAFYTSLIKYPAHPQKVMKMFLSQNILQSLIGMLQLPDVRSLKTAMLTIKALLQFGDSNKLNDENLIFKQLQQIDRFQKIEQIQMHSNQEIYELAYQILTKFTEVQP